MTSEEACLILVMITVCYAARGCCRIFFKIIIINNVESLSTFEMLQRQVNRHSAAKFRVSHVCAHLEPVCASELQKEALSWPIFIMLECF